MSRLWIERTSTTKQEAWMTAVIAVLFLLLLWALPAHAQEGKIVSAKPVGLVAPELAAPATPTVSEMDALRLDRFLLAQENMQLRIAQAQEQLAKLQGEVQTFVLALERPGFVLGRDAQGRWTYTPKPPEVKK